MVWTTGFRPARKRRSRANIPRSGAKFRCAKKSRPAWSMTGIRTGLFSSLFVKLGLGLLIVIFAVGFALSGIGPVGNMGRGPGGGGAQRGPDEPVARVGDQTISNAMFQNMAGRQEQMMAQFGQTTGPEQMLTMRQNVLEQMAGEAATFIEAKKAGVTATDQEIDKPKSTNISTTRSSRRPDKPKLRVRRNIEAQGQFSRKLQSRAAQNLRPRTGRASNHAR